MGNVIFVVIFVIFCAFLLGAGLISKRWVKESSDFVLAGREISTPINVVGVIAIGFAGTTVTLAPGFTIQYGLLGGLGWGVIYSVCGLLIFGLLYSNFVRRSGAQTLPEFLEMRYDGHTRSVVAITSVIGMCGIMANNVVSSVDNIAAFTGWDRTRQLFRSRMAAWPFPPLSSLSSSCLPLSPACGPPPSPTCSRCSSA